MRFYDLLLWISSLRWKQHQNAFFTNSPRAIFSSFFVVFALRFDGWELGSQREEFCLFAAMHLMHSAHTCQQPATSGHRFQVFRVFAMSLPLPSYPLTLSWMHKSSNEGCSHTESNECTQFFEKVNFLFRRRRNTFKLCVCVCGVSAHGE